MWPLQHRAPAMSQTSTQVLAAKAAKKPASEVSGLTGSSIGGSRVSGAAAAPAQAADKKSQVSKAGSTTTVLRKRIDSMSTELEKERAEREAAQRELEKTAAELAALEAVLTLRKEA